MLSSSLKKKLGQSQELNDQKLYSEDGKINCKGNFATNLIFGKIGCPPCEGYL